MTETIEELEREIRSLERAAISPREWPHHQDHARREAFRLRGIVTELKRGGGANHPEGDE